MSLVEVCRVTDVPVGTGISVELEQQRVAVFNVDGALYAMDGVCLHRGGPVGGGDLEDTIVTCPWHGWQYDVTNGEHVFDRSIGLRTYEVSVENGVVYVDLP